MPRSTVPPDAIARLRADPQCTPQSRRSWRLGIGCRSVWRDPAARVASTAMVTSDAGPALRGRRNECDALDRLLTERAGGSEPGAGRARRAGRREVGVAGVRWCEARPGVAWRRRLASSTRWSSPTRACISCARRCSICASGCPARSVTRSRRRSASARNRPRTASSSGWPCSACSPRSPRSSRSSAWSTMPSGWTTRRC